MKNPIISIQKLLVSALNPLPVSIADPVAVTIAADQSVQEKANSHTYVAGAGDDNVIKASAGVLVGIIVGKKVTGGIIEVSDHASDGDAAIKVYLEEADVGYYPVNTAFGTGISANITTQTNVTFVWR